MAFITYGPNGLPSPSVYSEQTEGRLSRSRHPPPSTLYGATPRFARAESFLPASPGLKAFIHDNVPPIPPLAVIHDGNVRPPMRSPTSTRSIIDHIGSPAISARPLSRVSFSSFHLQPASLAPDLDGAERRRTHARVLDYGGHTLPERPVPRHQDHGHSQRNRHHAPQHSRSRSDRHRHRRHRSRHKHHQISPTPSTPKSGAWFPAMQDRKVRIKLLHVLVSGGLLASILITFLALSSTSGYTGADFRIVLILFMLVFVILFLHSLIRLFMLIARYKRRMRRRQQQQQQQQNDGLQHHGSNTSISNSSANDPARLPPHYRSDSRGFAHPPHPIPVVLVRDEELGIGGAGGAAAVAIDEWAAAAVSAEDRGEIKGTPPPPPPPVYGYWRESVRVDPGLIHWQRVERREAEEEEQQERVQRPPSYKGLGTGHSHQQQQEEEEASRAPERQREICHVQSARRQWGQPQQAGVIEGQPF